MSPPITCVYKLINTVTGEFYIGQTVDFENRRRGHFKRLAYGNHHNPLIQASFDRYGPEAFEMIILERHPCRSKQCVKRENALISELKPAFNILGRVPHPRKGKAYPGHSEKVKAAWAAKRLLE